MCVQSRKLLPPKKDPRQFPAFQITVGYSRFAKRTPPYNQIVKLDITLNEVVCEHELIQVSTMTLRVSSLEDILAEKLRALLQQPIRKRNRPNDVFDIWYYATRFGSALDIDRIARFLQQKGDAVDGIDVATKALFRRDAIKERAEVGYSKIESRLPHGTVMPSFADAFAGVLSLVDRLEIPDM
jgi:predicted nucleotidyltransferase component of viral defense system